METGADRSGRSLSWWAEEATATAAGPVRAASEVSPPLCAFSRARMGMVTSRQAFRERGCPGAEPEALRASWRPRGLGC